MYFLDGIGKAVKLKDKFPHLKVMIGIGGWNQKSFNYSSMVLNKENRTTFIQSVLQLLKTHDLDGLDINWQFPGDRGGRPSDKNNYVLLAKVS